ncbi:MAG: flagella basal body P-ring formation protein FlgA [Novosphingobium sp.]|nr:flagella basal body P-ring formation protein FlgA [Novosphingobium sp.]
MTVRISHAALALAACCATPAYAQGFEDPAAIDRQVASFLGVDPMQAGGAFVPVDRRLRLNACAAPLDLSWYGTRRDSVLVQCPQRGGWKIYVRVLGASAGPVAAPAVERGDAVTVTLRGPGFSVSQSAEALEGGAVGEWIRVRVGKTGEMQAQVLRPGAVGMDLP